MRRIGLIGLMLTAAFVLSALSASSASALPCYDVDEPGTGIYETGACLNAGAPKEFIKAIPIFRIKPGLWCAKVENAVAEPGNYTNNTCTAAGAGQYIRVLVGQEGKVTGFPRIAVLPSVKTFKSLGGGAVLTASSEEVVCETTEDKGEITNMDSFGRVLVTFHGCKLKNAKGTCTIKSTNTSSQGLIVTNLLRGLLGEVAEAEATSKAGLLLEPETGVTFVTLEQTKAPCESIETTVEGSLPGEVVPVNTAKSVSALIFTTKSSKQLIKEITVLAGTKKPKLTAFGIATATEETTDALEFSGNLEIT
jgi:hypothetical protein